MSGQVIAPPSVKANTVHAPCDVMYEASTSAAVSHPSSRSRRMTVSIKGGGLSRFAAIYMFLVRTPHGPMRCYVGFIVRSEACDGVVYGRGRGARAARMSRHWVNDGVAPHGGAWSTRTLLAHVLPEMRVRRVPKKEFSALRRGGGFLFCVAR